MQTHDISRIIENALNVLQLEELTPMQKAVICSAADDKDVLLLSPTGSGKTLAFLLSALVRIHSLSDDTQILILAPSRELTLQIESVFRSLKTALKSCCCYGGHSITEEKKCIINNRPSLIIGTPGRITDHLRNGTITTGSIHTLIIDEFDKSLELGFHEQMEEIIKQLPSLKKRILLSATDTDDIPSFTGFNSDYLKLDYLEGESRIRILKVLSPDKDKIESLYRLLTTMQNGSTIVFFNHREAVDRAYSLLRQKGLFIDKYHGGMEQPERERAIYKFRNGSSHTLLSTDLAARGLDISDVSHIIHYHLPLNRETFIHRNGRTARWKSTGTSYVLIYNEETLPDYMSDIDSFLLPENAKAIVKPVWATIYIGKGKKDKINKTDIAGFLYKKGQLSKEDIGLIDVKGCYAFVAIRRIKINQMLNQIKGEKIKGIKTIIEEAR